MVETGLEERVARLEGRVEGFEGRFDGLDRRVDILERRIDALDAKVDRFRDELSARIDALDRKLTADIATVKQNQLTQFRWIVGTQVALFVAISGSFAAGFLALK